MAGPVQNWVFRKHAGLRGPFMAAYRAGSGDPAGLDQRIRVAQGIEILAGIAYFGVSWPDAAMCGSFTGYLREWLREASCVAP